MVTFRNPQVFESAFWLPGRSRHPLKSTRRVPCSAQCLETATSAASSIVLSSDLAGGFLRFLDEAIDRWAYRSFLKSVRNLRFPRPDIRHAT